MTRTSGGGGSTYGQWYTTKEMKTAAQVSMNRTGTAGADYLTQARANREAAVRRANQRLVDQADAAARRRR